MSDREPAGWRNLRMGAFFLVSSVVLFAALFIVGTNARLFERKYELSLYLPNAQQLGKGSMVALSGLEIGSVKAIRFTQREDGRNIQVVLSEPSVATVTIDYAITGGNAQPQADYVLANGRLTFAPGITTQTITFQIWEEPWLEPDETLTLTLSRPVNAWLIIERGVVIEERLVTLESSSDTIEIPIGANHAPNVYVSVVAVQGTLDKQPLVPS